MTNTLELTVRKVARTLHDYQVARLYKIPNDIKIVDGKLIHAEQTPPDFMGFTAGGRAIIIECKMCLDESLSLGKKGIKPHQLKAINEVHDAGGLGLVVWQKEGMIAVVDAGQVRAYTANRKSLPWKVIPPKFKREIMVEHLQFFWPFLGPVRCASR